MEKALEGIAEYASEDCCYTQKELDKLFFVDKLRKALSETTHDNKWVIEVDVLTQSMRQICLLDPPWEYVADVLVPLCEEARKTVSAMKYDELEKLKKGKGDAYYLGSLDKTAHRLTVRKMLISCYVAGIPILLPSDLNSEETRQYRNLVKLIEMHRR